MTHPSIDSARRARHAPRAMHASVILACGLAAGCINMSGLGGSTTYACKAPEGTACESVTGTYANAVQGNLPSQRPTIQTASPSASKTSAAVATPGAGPVAQPSTRPLAQGAPAERPTAQLALEPLRSGPRILRLWVKPWEDVDRDLHDQGFVYVQVDAGQWLIDHVQRRLREAYAPLRPPPRPGSTHPTPTDPTPPQRSSGPTQLQLPIALPASEPLRLGPAPQVRN